MDEKREMGIYEAAVEKWGAPAQILIAVEELAELQKALLKFLRYGETEVTLLNLSEERADVDIMLRQLDVIFGDNTEMEIQKLERLEEKVRRGE